MGAYASLIPVNIITGFLGSGKTTLLKRLLRAPELANTAVLVNELGEVGLDHHLIEHAVESTVLLDNGCVCCAMRDDLLVSLRELLARRDRGEIPRFQRLIIETSGLSDPVPIAYTVLAEPVLQNHYRLGQVITVVDAINGEYTLTHHHESEKQVAIADRIVLSKLDLAQGPTSDVLTSCLRRLNPSVPIDTVDGFNLSGAELFEDAHDAHGKYALAARWLEDAAHSALHPGQQHANDITHFALTFDEPLDWTAFGLWLSMLLNHHGASVLRVKGLLAVDGLEGPVLLNGVQHIVHPPAHLPTWPDEDTRSRIVFIAQGLDRQRIERSLKAFNGLHAVGHNRVVA